MLNAEFEFRITTLAKIFDRSFLSRAIFATLATVILLCAGPILPHSAAQSEQRPWPYEEQPVLDLRQPETGQFQALTPDSPQSGFAPIRLSSRPNASEPGDRLIFQTQDSAPPDDDREHEFDDGIERQDLAPAIDELKAKLLVDTSLDETTRNNLNSNVLTLESNQQQIESQKKIEAGHLLAIENANSRASESRSVINRLSAPGTEQLHLTVSLLSPADEVDRLVDEQRDKLEGLRENLNDNLSTARIARSLDLPDQIESSVQRIIELEAQIDQLTAVAATLSAHANALMLQSSLQLEESTQAAQLAEQSRYESEEENSVLSLRHDQLILEVAQAEQLLTQLEMLQSEIQKRIVAASTAAAEKEHDELSKKHPMLAESSTINLGLSSQIQDVNLQAEAARETEERLSSDYADLHDKFVETKTRIESIGQTSSVGAMLRRLKAELPDARIVGGQPLLNETIPGGNVSALLDDIQYNWFEYDQQRYDLTPEVIREEIETHYGSISNTEFEQLATPIADLIGTRKERLSSLSSSLNKFSKQLVTVDKNQKKLKSLTSEFREYINERILWIRSNDVLFSKLEIDNPDRVAFIPDRWADALRKVWSVLMRSPAVACLITMLVLLLLVFKPRMRNEVDRMGVAASRGSCDTIWPTTRALVLTVVTAIAIPSIPLLLGIAIRAFGETGNPLFNSAGPALIGTGLFAIPFEILRRMCRRKGLANQHFDWSDTAVAKIKQNLDHVVLPVSLLVFAIVFFRSLDLTHRVDLIDRSLFVAGNAFIAWLLYLTFNPKTGIFNSWLKANERSWANQTSTLWFGLILLLPFSLGVLAFRGYYYTALNLAACAFWTFVFAIVVETARAFLKRIILVRRRAVHIQTARRKREAAIRANREAIREAALAKQAAAKLERERAETARATAQTALKADPDCEVAQTAAEAATAAVAAATATTTPAPSAPSGLAASPEALAEIQFDLDIADSAKQAHKLISLGLLIVWAIGLFMIWNDVLPALRALDSYTVWPTDAVQNALVASDSDSIVNVAAVSGVAPVVSGSEASAGAEDGVGSPALSRVSVRDLLIFLVIAVVTLISARNLPSTLEMLFLEQLPVDRSFRYAIKAITSYVIIMLGVVLGFRAISIGWSNVQWLATALTFGLAFGLQEIFANFVAGIILMFERPIRIGDWITVDGFTGVVTRIKTRATTIINRDRKEYVIPNKNLITGTLLNWTLSDAINRVEIGVGIAYGSDVEKAKAILFEVCRSHPKTCADPDTQVVFSSFGESTLDLVAKTFLSDIDCRPQVTDDLHTRINAAFNEAGIEISFPQRDLHLRSIDTVASQAIQGMADGS